MAIFDKDKHIFSIHILFPPIPYRLTYTLQHLIHPRTVHKDAPGQSEARPDISTFEVSKVSINNESFLYFGRCESATPLRQVYTSQINLISILAHARIEVIHNYIPYEGIQYLVDREVGKIKRYFEQSLTNNTSLSSKEQRTVNAFLKRYGIKCRKIKRWEDLKIESIRNDCFKELTGDGTQTFYDGQYICHEEIESADPPFSHVQHQE